MIVEKILYPITYIKGLDTKTVEKLAYNNIILLKQLTAKSPEELSRETGVPTAVLDWMIERTRTIL